MKAIILFFTITCLSIVNQTELYTVKATFDGYEEGTYYFTDEEENNYYFEAIEAEASKKYDLTDDEFIGKKFNVTYKINTEVDEFNEEVDTFVIVKLTLAE